MYNYTQYPISIIPHQIIEAQNSKIPVPKSPRKPERPVLEKRRYTGFIITVIAAGLIIGYKFSIIPHNTWLTAMLVIFLVIGVGIAVYNCISNRLKNLANSKALENYEFLMRSYNDELTAIDEVNRQNNDRAALARYRSRLVKEALLLTNSQLKPADQCGVDSDNDFYKTLNEYFPEKVLTNYTIAQSDNDTKFIPNYIVSVSDKKLYIDVEIDVPYNLETGEPEAYVNNEDNEQKYVNQDHDTFFEKEGWVVIRFAEEQTVKHPRSCCKYIAQTIYEILEDDSVIQKFNTVDNIQPLNTWSYRQCAELEIQRYRETYLGIAEEIPEPEENPEPEVTPEENIEQDETEPDTIHENQSIMHIYEENTEEELSERENREEKQPSFMNTISEPPEPQPEQEQEPQQEQSPEPEETKEEEPVKQYVEPVFTDPKAEERKNIVNLVAKMNEYHKLEKWDFLLDYCNKVIAIDPGFQLAYLRRSTAYGNLGNLDNAIADCETIMQMNPENPDAYYNAAVASLMLRRYQKAIEYFKLAITNKIAHPDEVYLTLAGIYEKIGDKAGYNEYLQKSASLGNKTARVMIIKQKQDDGKNADNQFKGFNTRNIKIAHEGVTDICFSFNDEYIAISDQSRKLRVFSTSSWEVVHGQDVSATAMVFSRNNKYMAVGGQSFLRVLSVSNNGFSLFSDIINYTGNIKKMFFHPFNNDVLFVSDNFSLYKVDIKSKVINKAISDFCLMSVSRDMQYVTGKDYFNNIKIYRINALSEIFKLNVDSSVEIKSMSINTDASRLIYGCKDGSVYVYNPQIPVKVAEFNTGTEVIDIKISSNSSFFSILGADRKLRFFNTSTAEQGREITMMYFPKLITMSNSGNMIAIGNFNEDVDIIFANDTVTETSIAQQRTA